MPPITHCLTTNLGLVKYSLARVSSQGWLNNAEGKRTCWQPTQVPSTLVVKLQIVHWRLHMHRGTDDVINHTYINKCNFLKSERSEFSRTTVSLQDAWEAGKSEWFAGGCWQAVAHFESAREGAGFPLDAAFSCDYLMTEAFWFSSLIFAPWAWHPWILFSGVSWRSGNPLPKWDEICALIFCIFLGAYWCLTHRGWALTA